MEQEKCFAITEWATADSPGPNKVMIEVGDDANDEVEWVLVVNPTSALQLALQIVNAALKATGEERRVTRLLGVTAEAAAELDKEDDAEPVPVEN